MSRDRWIQWGAIALLILSLAISAVLSSAATEAAERSQLIYSDEASASDPPEVALGIAMGAFRGLFVNYLWIRANKLKEEGKFYEAIELSSAITRLQPRFPRVWGFHAWNMAYNISVATNTAGERWQWVSSGIRLLRDEGIPRNPNDVLLHKELAWIFFHKIQGFADDANHFYKRELAREWTLVLGEPPAREGAYEQNTRRMVEFLTPIVAAPDSLQGAIERELRERQAAGERPPEGASLTSMVAELAERIQTEARLPLGIDLLRFVELRLAWSRAWYMQESKQELRGSDFNAGIDRLMLDAKYADAWQRLLVHVRKRVLIDVYHMEPERMLRYTEKYGPLDWRHPATHAIYWASRGVEESLERRGTTQFDTLNTDRMILHSVQELVRYGQINFDLLTNEYFAMPDHEWVGVYWRIMEEELIPRGGMAVDAGQRAFHLYGAGVENLTKDAIRAYWVRGDYAAAERWHKRLRTWQGLNINDPELADDLTLPLSDFVVKILKDRITSPNIALAEIDSAITEAFISGLGRGRLDVFSKQLEYAQQVRDAYLSEQNTRTLADPEAKRMAEFVRSNFFDVVAQILTRLLAGGGFGEYRLGPYQASLLYRRTPTNLQRLVYDNLARIVPAANPGLTPEVFKDLFPEPPGMAELRSQLANLPSEEEKARIRKVEFEKDPNRKN